MNKIISEEICPLCKGPTVENPRYGLRESRHLCGNRYCPMMDEFAERQMLMLAVCVAAHEWQHISDDTDLDDPDEVAKLGDVEEKLALAVDALQARYPVGRGP